MEQVVVALDERLEHPGDTIGAAGHLSLDSYDLGEHHFALPTGVDYDLMLTNAGEGILASGIVNAHVVGECDRCLEEATFDVAGEVNEYFLFHEPQASEMADDEDEVDFSLVSDDRTIDLGDAIFSALLMDTPFVVLCKEDCKGLCPVCGANLNEEDCGHAEQLEQEKLANSPFAVLKDLV